MTTVKKLKYQTEVAEVIALLDKVSNAERKWKIGYDRSNQTISRMHSDIPQYKR